MRFGDKRWNEVVAVVLGLGLLAGSVALAGGLTTIMVFGGIAWVQFMATVLAAELLVLAPRRRRPELPFVAARWSRNPTLLHVIIGIGAVLMLVREGALAPVLTYSFSMYRSSSSTHVQRRDHRTTSGRISFRGRSVDCHIVCSPGGAMCDAFREASGCAPSSDAGAVRLEGAVDLGMFPLLCFSPLLKVTHRQLTGDLLATVEAGDSSARLEMHLETEMKLWVWGVASCLELRRQIGAEAGKSLAQQVNQAFASQP